MMDINFLAALVGAIASFACGALWYSPVVLLPRWMKESGVEPDAHRDNPAKVFGGSFVLTLLSAFGLAFLLGPEPPLTTAVGGGVLVGLLLVATSLGINYLFASRSLLLWLIDSGFHITRLAIIGLVLGVWP